ncbi:MAG TPA: aminodeoxychorismate synthase component I [Runella sp.]|nr:aminodeoxychorismate synthase component I [Runella sp.]HAO51757.1 aminodeoxychorismate synthase component I [Runella sp.]
MIPTLSAPEAIEAMNRYGRQRVPFLFIIDFLAKQPVVLPLADVPSEALLFDFNGATNCSPQSAAVAESFLFKKMPISLEEYLPKFNLVVQHLKRGDSFLTNLSIPTPIELSLDLKSVFYNSNAKYRLWWEGHFVCFSPEIFVQVNNNNRIASFPMKGTIDANLPDATQRILNDKKEAAEHATIVDLIRNDLSMIAQKVWVERYRYLDKLETNQKSLLQVSSEIAGIMPPNWQDTLGTWLFRLLPAGSISGAPKPSTLDIIQRAEGYERGYYTGVAGVFDGKNLDSGVLIRYIEQAEKQFVFKSGGGITARSQVQIEYQEMIDKIYLPIPNAAIYRNTSPIQRAVV